MRKSESGLSGQLKQASLVYAAVLHSRLAGPRASEQLSRLHLPSPSPFKRSFEVLDAGYNMGFPPQKANASTPEPSCWPVLTVLVTNQGVYFIFCSLICPCSYSQ
uniref:Uncharacterized protein n=1 Tax=Mus musculus TaxID=10090 RepID=Q8C6W7_MOUSE|nr:unnamed protein product [Mus musculus]